MPLPTPRPVVASPEMIAEFISKCTSLVDALWKEAYEAGRHAAGGDIPREGDSASRDAVLALLSDMAGRATYRVYVNTMRESHRVTYWTTIVSSNQAKSGRDWHRGRITPFMSENLEHALYEASNWAAFLGVEAEPWVKPDWHDELQAELQARREVAGKVGSGSNPQVGAQLKRYSEEETARISQGATTSN